MRGQAGVDVRHVSAQKVTGGAGDLFKWILSRRAWIQGHKGFRAWATPQRLRVGGLNKPRDKSGGGEKDPGHRWRLLKGPRPQGAGVNNVQGGKLREANSLWYFLAALS